MILASGSPRRLDLLRDAGFDPLVVPADIDETRAPGEGPAELVERLAREKARHTLGLLGPEHDGEWTVAADTVVAIDGDILGKPADATEARAMLDLLSGRTHTVYTGVCLARRVDGVAAEKGFVEATDVEFWPLSDAEKVAYIESGEAYDKAGGYGIQGRAKTFVKAVRGNYENVVGLPLSRLVRELG